MGASIEKSLCVGILGTRFDLFDDVKLRLKTGETAEGTIMGFEGCHAVQLETEEGLVKIDVDKIEGCYA